MSSRQKRLREGRRIRSLIASSMHDVQRSHTHIEDLLGDPPYHLGRVRVVVLLRCIPGMGDVGIKKCLRAANVWPEDRMDQLSAEDLQRVIDNLPTRARKSPRPGE